MTRDDVLVTAESLRAELASSAPPVVLDVRWRLTDSPGDGRSRYAAGHLPGARFLDLESVLTLHSDDPREGRHPLPDGATLGAGLGALGIRAGAEGSDRLVVLDEPGSFAAERAWWVLTWAGLPTRVLDGGLPAWVGLMGANALVVGDEPTPAATTVPLRPGHLPTLTADEAGEMARTGVLVDARAAERYRGEVEPLDPRAGHVPGARNLPAAGLFTADGTLPDAETLRAAVASAVGDAVEDAAPLPGRVGAYCGSGVSAARDVLALRVLGIDAPLFPGSWSAWSHDPTRAVSTGPTP